LLYKGPAHDGLDGRLLVGADEVLVHKILQQQQQQRRQQCKSDVFSTVLHEAVCGARCLPS
jgi:hypothetical protein